MDESTPTKPVLIRALEQRVATLARWHRAADEALVKNQIGMDSHEALLDAEKALMTDIDRLVGELAKNDDVRRIARVFSDRQGASRGGDSGRRAKAAKARHNASKAPPKRYRVEGGKAQDVPNKQPKQKASPTPAQPTPPRTAEPAAKPNGKSSPPTKMGSTATAKSSVDKKPVGAVRKKQTSAEERDALVAGSSAVDI